MAKLTDERLQEIRDHDKADSFRSVGWAKYNRAFDEREELLEHIAAQETELEDVRAAYQLTRHQLDAHRAGQGTYEGNTR